MRTVEATFMATAGQPEEKLGGATARRVSGGGAAPAPRDKLQGRGQHLAAEVRQLVLARRNLCELCSRKRRRRQQLADG